MKDPILSLIFIITKWKTDREIKWLVKECVRVEKYLNDLEIQGKDRIKIDYSRKRLIGFKARLEELKIKYGVNDQ